VEDRLKGANPLQIVRAAIKAVPQVKYAVGVAGIVALIAIITAFRLNPKTVVFGTIIMFGFMVVLLLFAKLTAIAPKHFLLPVLVTMWSFLTLVIASALLLFSAVFFQTPPKFHDWLFGKFDSQVQSTNTTGTGIGTNVPPSGPPREIMEAARQQSAVGEYQSAWKQLDDAIKKYGESEKAAKLQAQIAMEWLRNIRITKSTGKETFGEIVDLVSPSLYTAAVGHKDVWAADISAHLGWANYLKYKEGVRGLEIESKFEEALKFDPENPFAHAMWGFWILFRYGPVEEAEKHFASAIRSGRETNYVVGLHVSALLNNHSPESALALVRLADQLRQLDSSLDQDRRERILYQAYSDHSTEMMENLNSSSPVLPAAEHLKTLEWLGKGSDKTMLQRTFFTARLTEAAGDYKKALMLYTALKKSEYSLSGGLEGEIDRGIMRCRKPGA
jgi:hypothetical protein